MQISEFFDSTAKVLTLRLSGSFKFDDYRKFRDTYQNREQCDIVLDMRQLEVMDSAALGCILCMRDFIAPRTLTLANATGYNADLLEACHL